MTKRIILGGGCFWCIEAVYQRVNGVEKVESGYGGGDKENPTYHDHGNHAEVVQITYNSDLISLKSILEIFFYVHDPTTLNRQGNDIGEQYRSIIICSKDEVELVKDAIFEAQSNWEDPIVTELQTDSKFYIAEDFHQNYFNENQGNPYCQVVINPKLTKFSEKFKEHLK